MKLILIFSLLTSCCLGQGVNVNLLYRPTTGTSGDTITTNTIAAALLVSTDDIGSHMFLDSSNLAAGTMTLSTNQSIRFQRQINIAGLGSNYWDTNAFFVKDLMNYNQTFVIPSFASGHQPTEVALGMYCYFGTYEGSSGIFDMFGINGGSDYSIGQFWDSINAIFAHGLAGKGSGFAVPRNTLVWVTLYRSASLGTTTLSMWNVSSNTLIGQDTLAAQNQSCGYVWFGRGDAHDGTEPLPNAPMPFYYGCFMAAWGSNAMPITLYDPRVWTVNIANMTTIKP